MGAVQDRGGYVYRVDFVGGGVMGDCGVVVWVDGFTAVWDVVGVVV